MSTTTAYDNIETHSQSGGGSAWSVGGTIDSDTENTSQVTNSGVSTTIKSLNLSEPEFMASLQAGSEFVTLSVKFKAYALAVVGGMSYYNFVVVQDGTDVFSSSVYDTSTSFKTFSGDATYFGFTGTVQKIFTDIGDSSIAFRFDSVGKAATYQEYNLEDFQVQLEYREPDTKRASVIAVIP